jgi:hypothetical protein
MFLAGCSTTVSQSVAVPPGLGKQLAIHEITTTNEAVTAPSDIGDKLKSAVEAELKKQPQGSKPASMTLEVLDYSVVDSGTRLLIGGLGGSNRMRTLVRIVDNNGALIASYEVARTSQPGFIGGFYSQEATTIQVSAEAIISTLYGQK